MENEINSNEENLEFTRPIRAIGNIMHLTVNELVLAAGVIKIVRNAPIKRDTTKTAELELNHPTDQEIVFDELNQDEFTMRYADDKPA